MALSTTQTSTTTGPGPSSNPSNIYYPEVQVPISEANITSTVTNPNTNYNDPYNFINNKTYLLPDSTLGTVQFIFPQTFQPVKLYLRNVQQQSRGTKEWRFILGTGQGYANFTYVDGATGKSASCAAICPLPLNNATWQEFFFVNVLSLNVFELDVVSWYGEGAGFDGFTVYTRALQYGLGSSSSSAAASTSAASTSSGVAAGATTSNTPGGHGLSGGAKAGIGVGVVLGVLALTALGAFFWFKKRRAKVVSDEQTPYSKPELEAIDATRAEAPTQEVERHELPVDEKPVEMETHKDVIS